MGATTLMRCVAHLVKTLCADHRERSVGIRNLPPQEAVAKSGGDVGVGRGLDNGWVRQLYYDTRH